MHRRHDHCASVLKSGKRKVRGGREKKKLEVDRKGMNKMNGRRGRRGEERREDRDNKGIKMGEKGRDDAPDCYFAICFIQQLDAIKSIKISAHVVCVWMCA